MKGYSLLTIKLAIFNMSTMKFILSIEQHLKPFVVGYIQEDQWPSTEKDLELVERIVSKQK